MRDGVPNKDRLDEQQFTYKIDREGSILVSWNGKHVRTYAGNKAARLQLELESAETERDVQLALARITGNFKRGNER